MRDVILATIYQKIQRGENEPPLPVYEVTLSSGLPHGRSPDAARQQSSLMTDMRSPAYGGEILCH
jgi:hypothetical protein